MKRRPVLKPNVWNVPAFKHTVTALGSMRELGQTTQPLGLITAPAGDGKTFAAEWYAKASQRVAHAFCPPKLLLTTRSLAERLYEAVGKIAPPGRNSALYEELAVFLCAERYHLIVDEADRLGASQVDLLRELAEMSGIPITLMGCPGILATLQRVPAARHRIGFHFSVPPVEEADLHKLFDKDFSPDVVTAIYNHTHGNLRHVENLITNLGTLDNTSGETQIDADTVAIVATQCLIGAA